MKALWRLLCAQLLLTLLLPGVAGANCSTGDGLSLQILGSGGPFGRGRASSAYLVWLDGSARILVDAGGGSFTRFHETGALIADLELMAISHFHPDHSAEVPALLWIKPTDLLLSGPSGRGLFPSADEYVGGLFGPEGVYRAVTNGDGLNTLTIDVDHQEATEVWSDDSLTVTAIGVPHGIVPAVGYKVQAEGVSIVFASDQNGSSEDFAEFAHGADVLVAHLAIPENQTGPGSRLHARPSVWGQMATDLEVGTLVLSHLSAQPPDVASRSIPAFEDRLARVREHYQGEIVIAEDLMCIPLSAAR